MKMNKWTVGLAAAGLVSLPVISQAEEQMNQVWTALSSTSISGYVDTSAHWDVGTGNDHTPAYGFNRGKSDGFNLNAVKLSIERPLDESQWAAGYKVDLLFGPDANIFGTQSPLAGAGDFGVKQAYAALRAPVGNGLDFKMGVFDTIIGYEVMEGPNNPNYTRSWGWSIEPTTHTGALMSYKFNDMFSAAAGIADTLGPSINARTANGIESYKTYMGSLAFMAPDSWGAMAGATLYAGVINGNGGLTDGNQTSVYAGTTIPTPIEGLKVGASFDYVFIHDSYQGVTDPGTGDPYAGSDGSAYAQAVAGYISFQATEKLSLHGRAEYSARSDKLIYYVNAADEAVLFNPGTPDKVFALTGTVQYDLWKNVISRLEVRWDHSASGHELFGESDDDGYPTMKNAVLVAANVIYKF